MKAFLKRTGASLKESCRKVLVSLKRKPHVIALAVLVVAFLYYSLNLTHVSDTTAKIQGPGMGLCGFTTMLFSTLSLVCCLNAFPHRKKTNIPMLALMFALVLIVIFCDCTYLSRVHAAITRENNPIRVDSTNAYIATVQGMLKTHIGILAAALGLFALLPVYTPLLRKLNTSIDVADNAGMGEIDLTED